MSSTDCIKQNIAPLKVFSYFMFLMLFMADIKWQLISSMGTHVVIWQVKMVFSFHRQQQLLVQQSSRHFHSANDSKELTGNVLVCSVCLSVCVHLSLPISLSVWHSPCHHTFSVVGLTMRQRHLLDPTHGAKAFKRYLWQI